MTTKKNLNKEFGESMDLGIKNLVDNHKFHKATNHLEFDANKLVMPEGITQDSIAYHSDYINTLALQAEAATSQIARQLHGDNKELTTLDSTLKLGTALEASTRLSKWLSTSRTPWVVTKLQRSSFRPTAWVRSVK